MFFAMELLEGETLAEVLAEGAAARGHARARHPIQVGEALIEAHGLGYVHRDPRRPTSS